MLTRKQCPNIIILILDAVRAKHLSCYGYSKSTTPCLDAFADESVLFLRAFSPATWTIPTHASILSGLYLSQHRIENVKADRLFNESIVTLPIALQSCGYHTSAFSQNMLFSPQHHLGDFDEFYSLESLLGSRLLTRIVQRVSSGLATPGQRIARYARKVMAPRIMLDAVFHWVTSDIAKRPFSLMVNLANAHYPWAPPPDLLLRQVGFKPKYLLKGEFVTLDPFQYNSGKRKVTEMQRKIWRSLYDAAIMHLDREVGRFLRRLQRWQGWSDTIIVVTSDHGEGLGDYRDIVGHTLSLHDNIIHVPLIVRHPDYPPRRKVERVVQTIDLFSSAMEWAGFPRERVPPAQLQRTSLSSAVSDADNPGGFAFAEEDYTDSYNVLEGLRGVNPAMDHGKYPRQQICCRSATHKFIWCDDREGEFYNLVTDPEEKRNLISTSDPVEQSILDEHRRTLEAWRNSLEIFPPRPADGSPEIDSSTIERIESFRICTMKFSLHKENRTWSWLLSSSYQMPVSDIAWPVAR